MKQKKSILIVDDQEPNRIILSKLLSDIYPILVASNGKEALALMQKRGDCIAAVLLDLIMPEMDGYEVLRSMASVPELANIPVISISQSDAPDAEERALRLGARDYISKPVHPGALRYRLTSLVELSESCRNTGAMEHDSLTGLYNKEAFCRRAAKLLSHNPNESYILIATDVERFKLFNDCFGTAEGDRLLQFIGENLLQDVQKYQGLCARHSSDHFIALVPRGVDDGYLRTVVTAVKKKMAGYPLNMKISLNYGVYPVEECKGSVSIMCDRAILAAKSVKGHYDRSCAYYDDSIRQHLLREKLITDEMQSALKKGEFKIFFQPKYDLASEKIVGAEALVRWNHPVLGFLTPAEFIPLFERNGFITELDYYVWDRTCFIMKKWMKASGRYLPISVNVSRRDIYYSDLPEILLGLVTRHGIRPELLHLEITEAAYTENAEQLLAIVTRLKELGFFIEMDDFGSGYSSLNMLSELPIDILKLDMHLIQRQADGEKSRNILSFIISLAKWMNLPVVAERVETREQIQLLRNLDCNYVQGYYYSYPMPEEAFVNILQHAERFASATPEETMDECCDPSKLPCTGEKILLLADPDPQARAELGNYFRNIYFIVEMESGEDAYRYIQAHFNKIAVIILALELPEPDGGALLNRLRSNALYNDIPVIITGQCSEEHAFQMGANDFLARPYHLEVALRRVQNVTAHNAIQMLEREKRMIGRMQTLAWEASLDPLTGLCNRAEMESQVQDFFMGQGGEAVFLMLDIDNFKVVNDTYGHVRGDEAICTVAKILQKHFPENDVVCRMGGDEFSVFIPKALDEKQLQLCMNELCEKLRFHVDDLELSCSIGVCVAPRDGNCYQELYHNADIALLTAKRLGKNQYQIYGISAELPDQFLYRNMDWLLDESSDAVYVCDSTNYELLYLNNVACTLAGKAKKDCLGKTCYQAIWNLSHPCEHCVRVEKLHREYCEHEYQPKGTGQSYIFKGKLIDWGTREARIQYIQDNTKRAHLTRRMEALLEDRRLLLDLLPGGLMRYHAKDLKFSFIGENTLRLLGYSRIEFDKKFDNSYENLVWHEDRSTLPCLQPDRNSDYTTREYRIERKDGSLCCVYETSYFYSHSEGSEYYIMLTDVTELRQLRQQVQEQRDMLAAAIEHSGMISWEFDFAERSILLSPGAQRSQYHPTLLKPIPEAWLDLGIMDPAYNDAFCKTIHSLQSGQKSAVLDVEMTHPVTGEHIWQKLMFTVYSRDESGQPIKAIGTAVDITEQKIAEQKYTEESEFLNALSSSLVSSFRINLTAGYIEEVHSSLHELKMPEGMCFNDTIFRSICDRMVAEGTAREACYAQFCPTQLLRDYEAGRTEKGMDFLAQLADGSIRWLSLKLKMMRKPFAKGVIAFFSFWDISEQKRLAEVLHSLETTEFDAICTIDSRTGQPRVVYGQTLDDVLKYQRMAGDNVAGVADHLRATCCPEDAQRAVTETNLDYVNRALQEKPLHSVTYRVHSPQGIRRKRALPLS